MTWFKNSIKLLAVSGLVALATSLSTVSAISFSDAPDNRATAGCNGGTLTRKIGQYRTDQARFTDNNANSTYVYVQRVPYSRYIAGSCGSDNSNSRTFSFLEMNNDNTNLTLLLKYGDSTSLNTTNVFPVAGYSHTFPNGETVLMTNIFLNHGNYVLTDSTLTHSLQYFNNYILEDYILFVDPLQSSVSNGVDNVFLIHLPTKKAWSFLNVNADSIEQLFYATFTQGYLQTLPYTNSYDLITTTNTTIFPKLSNYMNSTHNYFANDTGFTYSKNQEFVAPDFSGEGSNGDSESDTPVANYFDSNLINGYNECVNKGENLRKALHLAVMCRYQDSIAERENIIYNTGLDYTGSASYCQQLDNFVVNLYNTYSGNWATGVFSYDINLQDNAAPINQLLFAWYYNSVVVDQNGNISGLPVGNSWCSAWTTSNFYNNEKSFIEKVSDSLTDFFGSGVAGTYIESVKDHASFSGLISSISEGSSGFFSTYLFNPYVSQFNSGSNAFYSKLSMNSCNDIKNTIGSYNRVDIILYSLSAILIFILIMLF